MDGLGNISDRMKATLNSYGNNDISAKKTSKGSDSEAASKAKPYSMLKYLQPPPTSGDTKSKRILNQTFLVAQLTVLAPHTASYVLTSALLKAVLSRKEVSLDKASLIKVRSNLGEIKGELEKNLNSQSNGPADAPVLSKEYIKLTQKQIKDLEKAIAKLDKKVGSLEMKEVKKVYIETKGDYQATKAEEMSAKKEIYTNRQQELESELPKLREQIQSLEAKKALPSHIECLKKIESNLEQQLQAVKVLATGKIFGKQMESSRQDVFEVGIQKLEAEIPDLKARLKVEIQRDKVSQLVAEMEDAPTMDQYRAKEAEAGAARVILQEMEAKLAK